MTVREILTDNQQKRNDPYDGKIKQPEDAANMELKPELPEPNCLPKEIDKLIYKCWEQNPTDRPTAAQLLQACQSALDTLKMSDGLIKRDNANAQPASSSHPIDINAA